MRGGNVSAPGSALNVTIDTVGPADPAPALLFETFQGVQFSFGEDSSASLSAADIDVRTIGGITPLTTALNYAHPVATFSFPGGILSDGNYRATLLGSGVTDLAGNALAHDIVLDFFVLAGDTNRDRQVDVADLGILASNWQLSPRTFSQGNFDYSSNGLVDVNDLGILASNWQKTLGATGAKSSGVESPEKQRASLRDTIIGGMKSRSWSRLISAIDQLK